jgi:hypothetical protein
MDVMLVARFNDAPILPSATPRRILHATLKVSPSRLTLSLKSFPTERISYPPWRRLQRRDFGEILWSLQKESGCRRVQRHPAETT